MNRIITVIGFLALGASANAGIENGSFELGNVGFSSEYIYGPVGDASTYNISSNPRNIHDGFFIMGDHSGGGNMMILNAATDGRIAWKTTATGLIPGQTYEFSAYVASVYNYNEPVLSFNLKNGVDTTPIAGFSTGLDGVWRNASYSFTAVSSSATFSIRDNNFGAVGNDFALDDISLRMTSVPEPSTYLAGLSALGMLGLFVWGNRK
jgi:hypothetical protein